MGLPTVRSSGRGSARAPAGRRRRLRAEVVGEIERDRDLGLAVRERARGGVGGPDDTVIGVHPDEHVLRGATSPLAKRSGFVYGIAKGIASMRVIFMRRASHADQDV